jgi:hypothetical protein
LKFLNFSSGRAAAKDTKRMQYCMCGTGHHAAEEQSKLWLVADDVGLYEGKRKTNNSKLKANILS